MRYRAFLRKVPRALFGRFLSTIFYQPRIDEKGEPTLLRPFFGEVNRKLMEKGYTTPWILTREQCWKHWDSFYTGNKPYEYAQKPAGIVQFLHEFWSPQVALSDSILELGSGSGANLYHLHELGYNNLMGIEISPSAIEGMEKTFPEFALRCNVFVGSLEDTLPKFDTNSVDAIFTMAVAQHIHPTSNFLFNEMVRVARKYVCTIEVEVANCSYIFARNYRRIFQKRGCAQLNSVLITKEAFPDVSRDYDGYVARLFAINKERREN